MQLALWLGRATAVAAGHRLPDWRGRDSRHNPRPPRAQVAPAPGPNGGGRLCRPLSRTMPERSPAEGGHSLELTGERWRCSVRRLDATERQALAADRCRGPPRERWKAEAVRRTPAAQRSSCRAHNVATTGEVVWCTRCGAYAELRGRGLARACPGRPRNKWAAERLRDLRTGIHPVSGRKLVEERATSLVDRSVADLAYVDAVTRGRVRWEALRDRVRKRARLESVCDFLPSGNSP